MADHWEIAIARAAAMHVAVAAPHGPKTGTKTGAKGFDNGFAKSQASRSVSDKGRENVSLAQGQTHRNAQGFLPFAKINAASRDFSGAVQAAELLIESASEEHQAKGVDEFLGLVPLNAGFGARGARRNRIDHAFSMRLPKIGRKRFFPTKFACLKNARNCEAKRKRE
jgi:hypothetical protein